MQRKHGSSFRSLEPAGDRSPRAHRRRAALLLLVVLATGQGCYSYRPTVLRNIHPGEQVRVVLEDEGYRRVAPGAPPEAARRVEGDFLRMTDDSVALSIWIGEAYRGTPFEAAHQEFAIPRSAVVRVEHRALSTWRTAVTAAGVVAVIATLIDGIGLVEVFGGDDDGVEPFPPAQPANAILRR